ncbi:hypothetical protein [Cupriavidus pampae]|uniref:TFIIS-type domain-containing protein n=1 Tax=Cupriavidus pampae TaxID=659251 RepID=A0ABM8XC68_9BURK|nr:hypothetical protein [Cupriavidus pampae]CAG9177668.1 hypothetical protein LMG32289_03870 [Cupriavidus pampae]
MLSFSVSDLVKLLEQLPVWKQVIGLVKEVEALKKRVEMLEKSQTQTPKGDECPRCHGLSYKLERTEADPTFGDMGVQRRVYVCGSCGHSEYKQLT